MTEAEIITGAVAGTGRAGIGAERITETGAGTGRALTGTK